MSTVLATIERVSRISAVIIGAVTFAWGVYQHFDAKAKDADTRRLQVTYPFLERQLGLYTELAAVTATIATSTEAAERSAAVSRFWQLHYGELALVQDRLVGASMTAFARALENNAPPKEVQRLSRLLTKQLRESLARSWGVDLWRDPDEAAHEEYMKLLMGD